MRVSASGLSRWRKCQASAILPYAGSTNESAEEGNAIHAFLDKACYIDPLVAIESVPTEYRARCAAIDVKEILKDVREPLTEITYALNPRTREVKMLGRSLGRAYEVDPAFIPGTADVIGKRAMDGKYIVLDWKTGSSDYVEPAKDNSQLLFFCVCLMLLHGADEIQAQLVYINDDGSHWVDVATISTFDMEDYLAILKRKAEQSDVQAARYAATGIIDVNAGEHCNYCGSIGNCPAQASLARRMLPVIQEADAKIGMDDGEAIESVEDKIAGLTQAQAAKAWVLKKQIGPLFDRVDRGLKAYARALTIPLESGKIVAPISVPRSFFSEDAAVAIMKELGASKDQIATCYRKKNVVQVREIKPKVVKEKS